LTLRAKRNVAKPRLFTGDRRLVNNADAKLWKVDIIGRSGPPSPSGSGSGGPRLSPTGDIPLNLTRSPRGQANAAAMVAVFVIVDALFSYLNSRFLSDAIKDELKKTEDSIRNWQVEYPADGALVSVNFARTELKDPLGVMKNLVLIHPGDRLEFVDVFYATTPEAAAKQLREQKSWLQGDAPNGPYQTARARQVFWVAPRLHEELLYSPVGTWRVQVDRFTFLYEFKENGQVFWVDPFNKNNGVGTWRTLGGDRMYFDWVDSKTVETWNLPMRPSGATGTCKMAAGTFTLKAVKI
jgi:hypothetical protein